MGSGTLTYTGYLTITSCWCGIQMALPSDLYRQAEIHGKSIYCPLGHTWVCINTTVKENERLRQQLSDEQARTRHARDDASHQRNRVIALRGVVTRTKKRIANGTCPCCTRTFTNLARHIAAKHPDYTEAVDHLE